MKRITSGQLAKAIAKCRPIVNEHMVRVWCGRGKIPADRNPGNEHGWWFILPDGLADALLKNIHLTPSEVAIVLQALGLTEGKQTSIFNAKKN